ncbi:MAG: hypothetical protein M3Y87_17405 [Myxococcota bacterium]|nr:hypothetical protein [Myxococcota bacterium]
MALRIDLLVALVAVIGVVAIAAGAGLGVLVEPMLPPWAAEGNEVAADPPADAAGEFDESADLDTESWEETPRPLANRLVAAELEAERYAAAGNERFARAPTPSGEGAVVPVPTAPREVGLLGAITDARLAGEDRDAFYLGVDANRRAESGTDGARFSSLRTTAGPDHRASYGVAQLTIRDHLFHLSRLSDAQLAELGVPRDDIVLMQRRAELAAAWYHVLVDRRDVTASAGRAGLDAAQTQAIQALANEGDRAALIARFGPRFASSVGLPASAIAEMADTLLLRRRELRDAFRRRYQHDHGVAFDPGNRDLGRMCASLRAMARERAELRALLARLGGGDAGAASLAHYLGVGDVAENYYGWYARAASQAVGAQRYAEILTLADPISSRSRELSNFENAISAVRGVRDLQGVERARMLARIGRCFHGAPGRARRAFYFDSDLSRPRATSAAELEAAIQEYRLGRRWSDERVQRAFDELVQERGLR